MTKNTKTAIKSSKISIPKLRSDLVALSAGYRKHPTALKGVKNAMRPSEVKSTIRKFDRLEAKEERAEKELAKIRAERNTLAAVESKRVARTKKIAKAVLSKEDSKDFR